MDGRRHIDIQTDVYLEELTDTVPEADTSTQTDAFLDRPPTPLFVPQKTGTDAITQIAPGAQPPISLCGPAFVCALRLERSPYRVPTGSSNSARLTLLASPHSGPAHLARARPSTAPQATCLTLTLRWSPSWRCWWARCWSRA